MASAIIMILSASKNQIKLIQNESARSGRHYTTIERRTMKDIITALKEIKDQGSFCGKRTTSFDDLQLEIKELGPLKFPLSDRSVKSLIKHAKPAKFGWREATILDKTVRNAWEIPKSRIKIEANNWNNTLKSTLAHLKTDLGLPESAELKASLHNLLIYEPGQFFSPHQDSEKLDGMVATLVVILPSKHKGGSLIIDHQDVKKTFQTSRFPLNKLTFIAFYADCHHEVKAIKEGYRLALTYNLVLKKSTQVEINQPRFSNDNLIQSLQAYFAEEDNSVNHDKDPKNLIYLLDHSYSQKGLSWNHLKNGDHFRAEALKKAANTLDLEIHMALADIQETWNCDVSYDYYRYRYKDKSCYDRNEEEGDNIELTELLDSNTILQYWIDSENESLSYKDCHVPYDQICWTKASNEFEPFDSQFEGWMGNYGNTTDRWYHRAAIILWRKKDHFPILFGMDPWSIIDKLLKLTKTKSHEVQLHQVLSSLLPYWAEFLRGNNESTLISAVLKLALYINDSQLALALVTGFDIHALTSRSAKLFLSLQDLYDTSWCLNVLNEWANEDNSLSNPEKCKNISETIRRLSENKNKNKALTDWLLAYQLKKIQDHDASCKEYSSPVQILKDTSERIHDLIDFLKACITLDHDSNSLQLIKYIIGNIELYPATNLIEVIHYLKDNLNNHDLKKFGYQKLFSHVFVVLKTELDQGLRKPNDWSLKVPLSCSCQDCIILNEFLQSNVERIKIWPLATGRRAHLHQKIDDLGIPVTHHTERTGSPYKLILTKTDDLHHHAKFRFEKLLKEFTILTNKINDHPNRHKKYGLCT
ncbi:MAG: 2OG-Fe(II) oxygenase [Gammaproteobacteria bacterium]|nr:2OG-Fe(II) oxygenase [Gammaproteobacteria bacterium]